MEGYAKSLYLWGCEHRDRIAIGREEVASLVDQLQSLRSELEGTEQAKVEALETYEKIITELTQQKEEALVG